MAWARQMRVKIAGQVGDVLPDLARLITHHLDRRCDEQGLVRVKFQVDGIPISLNHSYDEGTAFCREGTPGAFQDKNGRWRAYNKRLKPAVLNWRAVAAESIGQLSGKWQPTGATVAVLLFESPYWLTLKREVREKDVDNLIKPTLDAIQQASGIPDELHWQVHAFKLLSKRQRTTIFLYDLGTIVEYYF